MPCGKRISKVSRKIILQVEKRIRIIPHYLADLRYPHPVRFIKPFDKFRIEPLVADPGSKDKRQSGHILPRLPKIIDIGGDLALLKSPVADHHTRRRSPDLILKVDARIHKL